MPEEKLVRYSDSGAIQLGTIFLYAPLAKGLGYWVDMDFYFLKPFDFNVPYVFEWEYEGWINNALLRIPSDSNMAHGLCNLPQTDRRPLRFPPLPSIAGQRSLRPC